MAIVYTTQGRQENYQVKIDYLKEQDSQLSEVEVKEEKVVENFGILCNYGASCQDNRDCRCGYCKFDITNQTKYCAKSTNISSRQRTQPVVRIPIPSGSWQNTCLWNNAQIDQTTKIMTAICSKDKSYNDAVRSEVDLNLCLNNNVKMNPDGTLACEN